MLRSPQFHTWPWQAWAGVVGRAWMWVTRNSLCTEADRSSLGGGGHLWVELDAEGLEPPFRARALRGCGGHWMLSKALDVCSDFSL